MKNDYYVYLHKTLDGRVFYVGKGRCKRAWDKSHRSKSWHELSSKGYTTEIYCENLSEKDALKIEDSLITSLSDLVNKITLVPIKFEDFSEYFKYDQNSPSGLTRILGVLGGNGSRHGKLGYCGTRATRSNGDRYWAIKFKNRNVSVHRIIWQLFYGQIPDGFVIDHLDGDPLNNNIANLRMITQAENTKNTQKLSNNSSGVTGVGLQTSKNTACTYWRAQYCNSQGKLINKYFSISKLGNDEAFIQACNWRNEQIRLLNEEGAGYTLRHGT